MHSDTVFWSTALTVEVIYISLIRNHFDAHVSKYLFVLSVSSNWHFSLTLHACCYICCTRWNAGGLLSLWQGVEHALHTECVWCQQWLELKRVHSEHACWLTIHANSWRWKWTTRWVRWTWNGITLWCVPCCIDYSLQPTGNLFMQTMCTVIVQT